MEWSQESIEKVALMSEELKPCPFCGGEARKRNSQYEAGKMPWPTELWYVGCDACEKYCYGGSQVSIAIEIWNTRPSDPKLTEAMTLLDEIVNQLTANGSPGFHTSFTVRATKFLEDNRVPTKI